MDKCTNEVRMEYWKNIITQCQNRPEGQSAKQWMDANGIKKGTYYLWQKKIRQQAYEEITNRKSSLPTLQKNEEITFAELPLPKETKEQEIMQLEASIHPVAVLKTQKLSIAVSADIPEILLTRILQEVTHA